MASESDNGPAPILCDTHRSAQRLPTPIRIHCQMCSYFDEVSKRESFYQVAQLCDTCSHNTGFCLICQEPVVDPA